MAGSCRELLLRIVKAETEECDAEAEGYCFAALI